MRNDRDNEVLNDSPRLLPVGLPPNTNVPGLKSLHLQASSVIFKTDADGAVKGETSILLTAKLRAITGTPVFTVKSGTATLTEGGSVASKTLQFSNMLSDVVVIQVVVEDTSTFKALGNEPNIVYTDEVMIAKVADGSIGKDGDPGARTATGYLYYQSSRSSAPAKPSAGSFDFATGTFGSISAGWAHTPPTFEAGNTNKYWYAFYSVQELSNGGGQSVSIGSSSQGIGFSGLVTFSGTKLTNGSSNFDYTQIDGGWIKTGTISADRIGAGSISANGLILNTTAGKVKFGTYTNNAYTAIQIDSATGTSPWALYTSYGINVGTTFTDKLHCNRILCQEVSGTDAATLYWGTSGTGAKARISTSGTVAGGAVAFWSVSGGFYDQGGHGYRPFTGCHEGVVHHTDLAEPGDILVDLLTLLTRGVSDAICLNERSSRAYDKRAIGVFYSRRIITEETVVAAARVLEEVSDWTGMMKEEVVNDPALLAFRDDYRLVQFNALGEGLINVCGQNGNIEIGDLIVTSDMPGKGMKQDDDIVRNYTVAKSREAVTFSSPDEVKQVACIYLCG